jgi:hypothetical protein
VGGKREIEEGRERQKGRKGGRERRAVVSKYIWRARRTESEAEKANERKRERERFWREGEREAESGARREYVCACLIPHTHIHMSAMSKDILYIYNRRAYAKTCTHNKFDVIY